MKIKKVLLVAAVVNLAVIVALGQDLSVFDLKLNEPFNIRECKYVITDVQIGGGGLFKKKVKMYKYVEETPESGKCFQRDGVGYTQAPGIAYGSSKNLPPVEPVVNRVVRLVYAKDSFPSIITGRGVEKGIWLEVQNSKLQVVKFYFDSGNHKDVYQILVKKYGNPLTVDEMYLDRGQEGRREFYVAKWLVAGVRVTFTSVDTDVSVGGAYSQVGRVLIQYVGNEEKKEVNPL
ncbi:MAG: hypothetical protein R2684_04080 [Pyrinomonadaceae bacterium]